MWTITIRMKLIACRERASAQGHKARACSCGRAGSELLLSVMLIFQWVRLAQRIVVRIERVRHSNGSRFK